MIVSQNEKVLATLGDLLYWAADRLEQEAGEGRLYFGHGTDNAWDEAVYIVFHCAGVPLDNGEALLDWPVSEASVAKAKEFVERRIAERVPAAYLTQQAWFCGLPFYVDECVLVPRSPLAELIENDFTPWLLGSPRRILDLCTGSGCIGIACAHQFTGSEVVLSDLSLDALAVAEKNIISHKLGGRVSAVQSDLFENLGGQQFDLIVSNPPYVDASDFSGMPEEYQHEPEIGLTSGDDGLDFTRRLLEEAADYLVPGGSLIVEVGNSWEALEQAFPGLPFTWIDFERGGHGVFTLSREQLAEKG